MKEKKNPYLVIFVAIVVVAFLLLFWQKSKNDTDEKVSQTEFLNNPFSFVVIPEELDEATKNVVQNHINNSKNFYEENNNAWEAWIGIGSAFSLTKQHNLAIDAYRQSLVLQPNNNLGYRNIANVYKNDLKDYEKAAEFFELAIENASLQPDLYIDLALIYENKLDDLASAEQWFTRGVNITKSPDVMVRFIRFYQKQENEEKAREVAKLLFEIAPDNELYRKDFGHLVN